MRCLRAESIGLTSAWLPSRRSVEHQIGARSTTRFGQVRSGRSTVGYGRYFQYGIVMAWLLERADSPAVRETRDGYVAWPAPLGEGGGQARAGRESVLGRVDVSACPSSLPKA